MIRRLIVTTVVVTARQIWMGGWGGRDNSLWAKGMPSLPNFRREFKFWLIGNRLFLRFFVFNLRWISQFSYNTMLRRICIMSRNIITIGYEQQLMRFLLMEPRRKVGMGLTRKGGGSTNRNLRDLPPPPFQLHLWSQLVLVICSVSWSGLVFVQGRCRGRGHDIKSMPEPRNRGLGWALVTAPVAAYRYTFMVALRFLPEEELTHNTNNNIGIDT